MLRFLRFAGRLLGGKTLQRNCHPFVTDSSPARPRESSPDKPIGFTGYVRRYRLTEADLHRLHRRHAWRCYSLLAGALFALAFGATSALASGGELALLAVLWALLFLAGAASGSLRAWQIRQRRLGSLGDWLRQPHGWFPPLTQ